MEDEKPRKESSNVIDLMAALKKSLESGGRTPAGKRPAKKAAGEESARQEGRSQGSTARRKAS